MKLISTVHWGKPVLKLLSHVKDLNEDVPTSIIIRHSERDEPEDLWEILEAQLTERGRQTAVEFGEHLPVNKTYRIYHSPVERCRDTARFIEQGIIRIGGKAIFMGEMENLMQIECISEKFIEYLERDSNSFVNKWFSGAYPPEEIEPAINVAQRTALEITKNFQKSAKDFVDIYVSHDFHVINYLFYWGGILALPDWIQYLDGFMLQFKNDKLSFYYNGGKKEVAYPYWWKERING